MRFGERHSRLLGLDMIDGVPGYFDIKLKIDERIDQSLHTLIALTTTYRASKC